MTSIDQSRDSVRIRRQPDQSSPRNVAGTCSSLMPDRTGTSRHLPAMRFTMPASSSVCAHSDSRLAGVRSTRKCVARSIPSSIFRLRLSPGSSPTRHTRHPRRADGDLVRVGARCRDLSLNGSETRLEPACSCPQSSCGTRPETLLVWRELRVQAETKTIVHYIQTGQQRARCAIYRLRDQITRRLQQQFAP